MHTDRNIASHENLCQTLITVMGSHLEDVWEVSEVEDVVEFDGCWKKGGCHLREEGREGGK